MCCVFLTGLVPSGLGAMDVSGPPSTQGQKRKPDEAFEASDRPRKRLKHEVAVQAIATLQKVTPGGQVHFVAQVTGTTNQACIWEVIRGGGEVSSSGLFTAPLETKGETCVIRVTSQEDPEARAEVAIQVEDLRKDTSKPWTETLDLLPEETRILTEVLGTTMGKEILTPWELKSRPFVNFASGQRFLAEPRVVEKRHRIMDPAEVGVGLEHVINNFWKPAKGALLSYRQGEDWTRVDGTGPEPIVLKLDRKVDEAYLELLSDDGKGGTFSQIIPYELTLRGVMPFAGNPDALPGHVDGRGREAAFLGPTFLAAEEGSGGFI